MSVIDLGDPASEEYHELSYDYSEVITGGLGEKARRLLPRPEPEYFGGKMSFWIKVDPEKQNYVTFKFWGSETNPQRSHVKPVLFLFHDDRMINYGIKDRIIDLSTTRDYGAGSEADQAFPERFFYVTRSLPKFLTEGRESVRLTLQSAGNRDPSDRPRPNTLSAPARSTYRIYSHVDPFFEPPADESQGEPVELCGDRDVPEEFAGRDLEELLAEKADSQIREVLGKEFSEIGRTHWITSSVRALARAYTSEWSEFHQNEEVLERVIEGL